MTDGWADRQTDRQTNWLKCCLQGAATVTDSAVRKIQKTGGDVQQLKLCCVKMQRVSDRHQVLESESSNCNKKYKKTLLVFENFQKSMSESGLG